MSCFFGGERFRAGRKEAFSVEPERVHAAERAAKPPLTNIAHPQYNLKKGGMYGKSDNNAIRGVCGECGGA